MTRDESSAGGAVTSLVFSGGTSVQEYDNGATTPTVEYIRGSDYGGGVGGILYTLRGGTPSYTHANKRGDVVAKTNGSGTLTYQAQYEAFGKQVATAGSTLDRQKSNSKDTDPTGLVDEGMRYRDLETGMFINRDPAGFVDGPNLYTYVIQNPWTHFDPEGLDTDWHHELPQAHEKEFQDAGIDIHDSKYGRLLDRDSHQELHNEGEYNKEWDKFFSDNKEKFKGMTQSAKQTAIESQLEAMKGDSRYKDILQAGADVPQGLDYKTYSAMGGMEKSQIIKQAFGAKKAGKVLEWAKPAAKFAGDIPLAGTLLSASVTYAADAAAGKSTDETNKDVVMTITNADLVKWAAMDSKFGQGLQATGSVLHYGNISDQIDAEVNGWNGQGPMPQQQQPQQQQDTPPEQNK